MKRFSRKGAKAQRDGKTAGCHCWTSASPDEPLAQQCGTAARANTAAQAGQRPMVGRDTRAAIYPGLAGVIFAALAMWCLGVSIARGEVAEAVLRAEAARIAVMDQAKEPVLAIFAGNGRGGGSGVVVSADGYALTNFHVAQPCGKAMKCGMADGNVYDAVIVGLDPTGDLALIKLFGRDDFPHAELADSDRVRMGDSCFAMGNPFLLATNMQPTVTYGIVSGVHRYQYPSGTLLEYTDCIQTDASINPGNSGGPLFDSRGRLIGINGRGSFEKRGRVNVGVAYAISSNQIQNFLGYLHSGRIVDHATLGAVVYADEQGRVVVSDILEESDAFRRGLRYGDEIVNFAGRPITTPNGFKNVLGILPKGWRVPLSYRRGGKRYDILVRLRGVHGKEELLEEAEGGPKTIPMPIPKPEEPGEEPKPGEKPKPGERRKSGEQPRPGERPRPGEKKPPLTSGEGRDNGVSVSREPVPHTRSANALTLTHSRPTFGRCPERGLNETVAQRKTAPGSEPAMPAVCQEHFEAKHGYANYYYNKLHRDRVMKAWTGRCDLRGHDGIWTLAGELANGGKFRFQLGDRGGTLKLPNSDIAWEAGAQLGASLAPPQSGGLMPALYAWRHLAVAGPEKFDEVSYLGTAPLAGRKGLYDVLLAAYRGIECRFMFDPAEGHLLAMEMSPEEDTDPCEIYFSEYHEVQGRFLPGRMDVRVGDDAYGSFKLTEFSSEKVAENTGEKKDVSPR